MVLRVTHRSMACRSMNLCASFSVILSCSMSTHFARLTSRISAIFSSSVAVFCSMRRRRARVAQRSWSVEEKKRGGGRLLERQYAALTDARGHVGVLLGAHEKKNARLRALADIEGEIRAEFVRQRRVDDQKIIAALQKTSPGA